MKIDTENRMNEIALEIERIWNYLDLIGIKNKSLFDAILELDMRSAVARDMREDARKWQQFRSLLKSEML